MLCLAAVFAGPAVATAAVSPRMQVRFDAGWRFHRGDMPAAAQPTFDDSAWRTVDLPHDFSIEDLPAAVADPGRMIPVVPGDWKFKKGDDPAWKAPDLDDSGWQPVTLPAHWSDIHVTGQDSYGWYRRRFQIPESMRGKEITLAIGKVDDVDETFVNGVKVGGEGSFPPNYSSAWTQTRFYQVPAKLLKGDGTDSVAIRDYNGDGDAGIYEAPRPPLVSGPFDSESPGGTAQGYTDGGIAWYRKQFRLPVGAPPRVSLTFDGVYMNSTVWLNGTKLGVHPYGYTGFSFDITPYVHRDGLNTVAVRVDSSGRTSRWYSGSGIYRHVWLTAVQPVHVGQWGVFVTTPEVSQARAVVHASSTVFNEGAQPLGGQYVTRVLDGTGKVVAQAASPFHVNGHSSVTPQVSMSVTRPALWSPDNPSLYHLVTRIEAGGQAQDEVQTPFGIRSIHFDAGQGFVLNGKPLKMRGGCVHHDNGPLGSRTYDRAEDRRVELLKAAGFNAIRTSHNPPSPEFLDACDRQGMLVLDEAFDCWNHGKNPDDYGRYFHDWWQSDLSSMVLRDRNHPSVVFWSIGNEIPEQHTPEGAQTAGMLAHFVRSLDPTRPVAEATNPDAEKLEPLLEQLDVVGYNYAYGRYPDDHQKHPDRIFASTESFPGSCFDTWMATVDHPYVVGDFVWTALDYLGEAGIGKSLPQGGSPAQGGLPDNRLWTVSNCGDLDIDGMRRPPSYYRSAVWGTPATLAMFVVTTGPDGKPYDVEGWGWRDERPSWTFPGREGQSLTVHVYSSYPQVRLLLNGRDLGTRETDRGSRYMASWEVPYEPGELTAVAIGQDGSELARSLLQTAGPPAALRLAPDRNRIAADGEDLSYVTVEVVDAKGQVCPDAAIQVRFKADGAGTLLALSNADPRSTESFQRPERTTFHGRALAILKAGVVPGTIHLSAAATGLQPASTAVQAGGE